MKKILLILGMCILLCSIALAQEGTGDETSGRNTVWYYFEQQPVPQVTNLTFGDLGIVIGITYVFWKYKKK